VGSFSIKDSGGVRWRGQPEEGNGAPATSVPASGFVVYCDEPVPEGVKSAIARCIERHKPAHTPYKLKVKRAAEDKARS
jgi:hypothetical protein